MGEPAALAAGFGPHPAANAAGSPKNAHKVSGSKEWLSGENDISFRLGRLYRDENQEYKHNEQGWKQLLSEAEKLSVFWNTPPYNSHYIKKYEGSMNLRIINLGNRGSLLMEYSSPYWKKPLRPDDSAEI